jgi:hypothetical protein
MVVLTQTHQVAVEVEVEEYYQELVVLPVALLVNLVRQVALEAGLAGLEETRGMINLGLVPEAGLVVLPIWLVVILLKMASVEVALVVVAGVLLEEILKEHFL